MLTARVLFILHLTKITKTSNFVFFFFNDTATTEIYTLSLHDALPICQFTSTPAAAGQDGPFGARFRRRVTKLFLQCRSEEHTSNSSHLVISYAVFCLKKKKKMIEAIALHTHLYASILLIAEQQNLMPR